MLLLEISPIKCVICTYMYTCIMLLLQVDMCVYEAESSGVFSFRHSVPSSHLLPLSLSLLLKLSL